MSLTEEIIEECSERFVREWDRYEKLTRVVESICRQKIAEESSLRVNITARTKSPESFARKLRRFVSAGKKPEWNSAADVFEGLSDFSGVRIAYYLAGDEPSIREALSQLFLTQAFDKKEKRGPGFPEHSNYSATHCQVSLKEEQLSGVNGNLLGLTCEIQICSMMAHVWNEIEHDIAYKPTGVIGAEEKSALASLASIVRHGDEWIQRLLEAHASRIEKDDAIASPKELVVYVADLFCIGRVTFWDSVGRLYNSLQRLDLCSKQKLVAALGVSWDWSENDRSKSWATAKRQLADFNRWAQRNSQNEFILSESKSADPLLMILLEQRADWVLRFIPAGQGKGRPPWIRGLASRYQQARPYLQEKGYG
jgi:ppGpp synthetase/RelA/SpoT-type nucleotidyltranferase